MPSGRIVATIYGSSGKMLSGDWKSHAAPGADVRSRVDSVVEQAAKDFLAAAGETPTVLTVRVQNADGSAATPSSSSGRFEVTYV